MNFHGAMRPQYSLPQFYFTMQTIIRKLQDFWRTTVPGVYKMNPSFIARCNRRKFVNQLTGTVVGTMTGISFARSGTAQSVITRQKPPNILFAISDDQSWPHSGAYGCSFIQTPAFDRIAEMGCLLNNAFCAAPQCSPNRASLLTGRHIWQNEEAGTHASLFPRKLTVFTELLREAGYATGYTGKPWGPGNWKDAGWTHNPVGPEYNERKLNPPPANGIHTTDYAENFEDFLKQKPHDTPFFFWYGGHEPHRGYQKGIGIEKGKRLEDAEVPPFLPDTPEIRSDLLDYAVECEYFDSHLERMLQALEQTGELKNTLIVVTSDNGMSFPCAKANMYEYGIHVPFAVCWPSVIPGGRRIDDLISFVDIAPTILNAAGVPLPDSITGRSFLDILQSDANGIIDNTRNWILAGRERHSHARYDNLGYPSRAIRTPQFLYIHNLKPERRPSGDPPFFYDIDNSPSKAFLIDNQKRFPAFYDAAFANRPAEELFNIQKDPGCLNDLANDPAWADIKTQLNDELHKALTAQHDPRTTGSDVFDSYPRFNEMREQLGGFSTQGEYNPKYQN